LQDVAKPHSSRAHAARASPGRRRRFEVSLQNLSLLLMIAVMVVYIVLGVLYESYVHPLTILSGLPSAGTRERC